MFTFCLNLVLLSLSVEWPIAGPVFCLLLQLNVGSLCAWGVAVLSYCPCRLIRTLLPLLSFFVSCPLDQLMACPGFSLFLWAGVGYQLTSGRLLCHFFELCARLRYLTVMILGVWLSHKFFFFLSFSDLSSSWRAVLVVVDPTSKTSEL